ncbi:site-specific integrase [Rhodopila sp.]|uniref:site-specific integrase n=1 Tax=Rhodopila sp. TaxID=2480087 RepID=UPI003D0F6D6F
MASISRRGPFWRVRIRCRGETLSKTFDTEAEARVWADREEVRVAAGATAAVIRATPSSLTVAALFERYAREVSPTKRGERWEVIRLRAIAPAFPMLAIEVDGATMAEWRDRRLKSVSPATVNRELSLISTVFTRAIKEWRLPLPANPVHQVIWPSKPRGRRRRVSDAERAAIIHELGWDGTSEPNDIRSWIAWSFCLALETMMRQGELLALTWGHIHIGRKFCHLPHTKNGHERNVPLSSRAVALLNLLTIGRDGQRVIPVEAGTFGAYFREAVKGATIEDLHFHDTRREALTRAATKITNVAELARASGHRELRSLMVYFEPDVTEIAEKLG